MPPATIDTNSTPVAAGSDTRGQTTGSFMLVLRAHVPYVLSHGKWPYGTDWLSEAAAETYIPLLNIFNRLVNEGISPRVTVAISPILCDMLVDLAFLNEFDRYLQAKIDTATTNAYEFAEQDLENYRDIALFWQNWYTNIARDFEEKYDRDIISAFRRLQDAGHIELITCAASHAYLPLLGTDEAVQAQVRFGVDNYRKHFARQPRGMWLPECGYRPRSPWSPPEGISTTEDQPFLRKGIDEFLAENYIEYFITDTHLLKGGKPTGGYSERFEGLRLIYDKAHSGDGVAPEDADRSPHQVYLVSSTPETHVACFTRHEQTSMQVWSTEQGYPAAGTYLDFHKKHYPGGHRLWRVTSADADLAQKEPYEPLHISECAETQANHFVSLVKDSLRGYHQQVGQAGVICCPYDAELFGHWWFEGPNWLYRVLKKISQDDEIGLTTGSHYIDQAPPTTVIALPEGSWGEGGSHFIWLNPSTTWSWREIHECEKTLTRLVRQHGDTRNPKLRQILQQCGRELLLMESSDWQFLISTAAAREYAELRLAGHINVFQHLVRIANKVSSGEFMTEGERKFLEATQERDRCFENLSYQPWADVEFPPEEATE